MPMKATANSYFYFPQSVNNGMADEREVEVTTQPLNNTDLGDAWQ
jgi:hypothetical protein